MIQNVAIPALPAHERPRERLGTLGASALSDAELVAIQLGSGGPGESAIALVQALLAEWGGVAGLARAAVDELARRRGVGPAKAARLVAAFALADRVAGRPQGRVLRTSADVAAVAAPLIGRERVEQVILLIADHGQRVLRLPLKPQVNQGSRVLEPDRVLTRPQPGATVTTPNAPAGARPGHRDDHAATVTTTPPTVTGGSPLRPAVWWLAREEPVKWFTGASCRATLALRQPRTRRHDHLT
jgi:DNA repair protein RadC